jgi:hypothetical protein|tara:strand:+ start:68 stop:313 length:246 start_codon:yes stop_codon:yes gene_type:complete
MAKFIMCPSCEFEVVPNDDGTCYNCSEPVELVDVADIIQIHHIDETIGMLNDMIIHNNCHTDFIGEVQQAIKSLRKVRQSC